MNFVLDFFFFFLYCLPTPVIFLLVTPIFTARATYIYRFPPISLVEYLLGKDTHDIEFIFIYLFVCLFIETVSLCTYYSSVPIAVINTMTQRNLGQARVYFILQLVAHHPEKAGQQLKAGNEEEVAKECCLLTCSTGLHSLFSYTT